MSTASNQDLRLVYSRKEEKESKQQQMNQTQEVKLQEEHSDDVQTVVQDMPGEQKVLGGNPLSFEELLSQEISKEGSLDETLPMDHSDKPCSFIIGNTEV